jgi:hypothetical protein
VWSKAVGTVSEATALFLQASPPVSGTANLVLYYPCNDNAANTPGVGRKLMVETAEYAPATS